ncbi:hypothetical protein BDQ12DRAFT_679475 [Crucibulum laeve]|uniref:Uncharacterized protein n=1 Tax=Crucibulum laeve TaxID=68775 RepID=A0A5C3M579_9AGAR|nr:hypothetical protein BDQ12DRAFT_679475 [Crucibulum laeve]
MIFILFSAFLLCLQLVTAIPLTHTSAKSDSRISHIAHNTLTRRYFADRSDGSLYGEYSGATLKRNLGGLERRDAGNSCTNLSVEEAKELPGWSKLEQYAKDTWGTRSWNIVTNPNEYLDRGATACVDGGVVRVQMDGEPTCNENKGIISGSMIGTNGSVKLSYGQGYSSSASWSVTKTTSLATAAILTAGVEIPDIVKIGGSVTTTTTFENPNVKGFETEVNNMISQEMIMDQPDGKTCVGTINTKSCNVGGKGSIRTVASGFVWFNYDDKRAPNNDPEGGEHYKYAANIESVLSLDERSGWVDFRGSMQADVKTDYSAKCT